MGNCQGNGAAAVVIQHPDGRAEHLYRQTSAEEVMRTHPGHYVALVTLSISKNARRDAGAASTANTGAAVRFTRVRLLKHKEMLLIGQVYRLITCHEVTKAIRARKLEKIRKVHNELVKQQRIEIQQQQKVQENTTAEDSVDSGTEVVEQIDSQAMDQAAGHERERQRSSRNWRPSLQSISEVGS